MITQVQINQFAVYQQLILHVVTEIQFSLILISSINDHHIYGIKCILYTHIFKISIKCDFLVQMMYLLIQLKVKFILI